MCLMSGAFIHLDVQPCSEQFHAGNVCFPAATFPNQKERAANKPSSSEAWESHRDLHPVTVAGISRWLWMEASFCSGTAGGVVR